MIKFYKISKEQWKNDFKAALHQMKINGNIDKELVKMLASNEEQFILSIYDELVLPCRATIGSAGYDFFWPFDITVQAGETILLPSGFRCQMPKNVALFIYPRSSIGFKYRWTLNNTVGIIDSDYFNAENEGHIWTKWTNCGNIPITINKGQGYAQGVFMNYLTTDDDAVVDKRIGGLGSTDKK